MTARLSYAVLFLFTKMATGLPDNAYTLDHENAAAAVKAEELVAEASCCLALLTNDHMGPAESGSW